MYEYLIIDPAEPTRNSITATLNKYGAEGWEHYLSDIRGNLYLKREKQAWADLSPAPAVTVADAAPVIEAIRAVQKQPIAPPLKPRGK